MKIGSWNVRRFYRAGSFKAAARELGRYKLDVVVVHEVRWDKGGSVTTGDFDFFYRKGNENHQLGTGFFVHRRIVSALKRVEFASDRLSYIVLGGRWRNNIVVNVRATSEKKCDTSKDSFYAQLEQVFYHLPKYHLKILLGEFNAKLGGRKFLNQQSDRRVSIGIVMIIGLEYLPSPHPKIWWLRAL